MCEKRAEEVIGCVKCNVAPNAKIRERIVIKSTECTSVVNAVTRFVVKIPFLVELSQYVTGGIETINPGLSRIKTRMGKMAYTNQD